MKINPAQEKNVQQVPWITFLFPLLSHSNFQFKRSLILAENLLVSVDILRVLGFSTNKISAFWVDWETAFAGGYT